MEALKAKFKKQDYQKKEGLMPVIIVEMMEGRNIEQKQQLAEGLTAAFVKQGVSPDAVQVIFRDNPRHNWAKGGKLDIKI